MDISDSATPTHRAILFFASLPDSAHRTIAVHISTPEQLRVAATASSMLPAYGCRLARLRFGVDAPPEGLQHMVNVLRRQEALEKLVIAGKELLPALLPLIVDGVGQRLKKLQLGEWLDVWSDFIAEDVEVPLNLFQGLPTVLSALEELRLFQRWPEALDQEALWVEFAQGSLPRLRALTIYPGVDADTQDAALESLAMALEARETRGCAGLAELHLVDFNWMAPSRPGGGCGVCCCPPWKSCLGITGWTKCPRRWWTRLCSTGLLACATSL